MKGMQIARAPPRCSLTVSQFCLTQPRYDAKRASHTERPAPRGARRSGTGLTTTKLTSVPGVERLLLYPDVPLHNGAGRTWTAICFRTTRLNHSNWLTRSKHLFRTLGRRGLGAFGVGPSRCKSRSSIYATSSDLLIEGGVSNAESIGPGGR